MKIEPFSIDIPQADLDDLRTRLARTRWADDFGNARWTYGVERRWLEAMVAYWRDVYDWRAREAAINRYPQFRVEIDGVPLHFLHVRGRGPRPTPLILTHGWPWTFWDYRDLIEPLTDPGAHGGDPAQSFDLVIPSLPGFGFSTPLQKTGIDVAAIAGLWVRLMTEGLGYRRFGAAGGDWGAAVTAWLGHAHEDHVIGSYMTLPVVPGVEPPGVGGGGALSYAIADYAPDEQWMLARNAEAGPLIISHITVHWRDPQTLAYALVDSPVGTAAWLWERRRAWSDCGGDPFTVYSRDDLCTLASIYWLTGTIGTSLRLYAEYFNGHGTAALAHKREPIIGVPTGYGVFPKDVTLLPRAVAARHTNLAQWTVMPKGGHFAPAEQPGLVTADLRRFFHRAAVQDRRLP